MSAPAPPQPASTSTATVLPAADGGHAVADATSMADGGWLNLGGGAGGGRGLPAFRGGGGASARYAESNGGPAFAALLSGGLVRSARRIGASDWVGSVVRDPWRPFAIVFAPALIFALTAQHYYPDALTLSDVLRRL